jgi:outer membrane protein assembly factor BamB
VWETDVNNIGDWTLSIAVADGKVFAGESGLPSGGYVGGFKHLYALDAYTGDILWKGEGGGASAAIYKGKVFTIHEDGRVFAYGGGDETVDLVPAITSISRAYENIPLEIEATIINAGSTYTRDVNVSLEINGVEVDNRTISILGGNLSEDLSFSWTPSSIGAYSIEVIVDPDDDISETDNTNNIDSITLPVIDGAAEVMPLSLTPGHIYVNQPYEMTATVSNTGADTSESFNVTVKQGSTVIATGSMPPLYPGNDADFTFMWTASSSGSGSLTVYVENNGSTALDAFPIEIEPGTAIEEYQATDWPQFQKSWLRNGTVEDYAVQDAYLEWDSGSDFTGNVDIPPVVLDDTVYIFSADGTLCAFDKYTGSLLWNAETGESASIHSSTPACGDGNIFVATYSGSLYAYNAETGRKQWKVEVTNDSFEMPVTYYDHRIYIGDGLGNTDGVKCYYCYDDLGNRLWAHEHDSSAGFVWNGAAVAGDYVVYSVHEGSLVSLNRITGELADEVNLSLSSEVSFARDDPGLFRSSVVFYDDFIYTTSERGQTDGYLWKVGFDTATGEFVDSGWSVYQGFSTSTPAILNDRIYVGQGEHGETGALNCFDLSGTLLWSYSLDEGVKSSPAVVSYSNKTFVYFTEAANNGSLYCIVDMDDHADKVWEYNPPDDDGYILQGAAVSDGFVYFGTNGDKLYCLGPDWNPWNDITSDSGKYITIDEVMDAYNCWRKSTPASTGSYVSIDDTIDMYNAWRGSYPMV